MKMPNHHRDPYDNFPSIVIFYSSDLKITYSNRKAKELFGTNFSSLNDLINQPDNFFAVDDDRLPFELNNLAEYTVLQNNTSTDNFILGIYFVKTHEYKWFDVSVTPTLVDEQNRCLEVMSLYKDITYHFISKNSFVNIRKRYQLMLEGINNLVFQIVYSPHPQIAYVSPNISDFMDLTPNEIYGDFGLISKFIHPDDRAAFFNLKNDKFLTNKPFIFRIFGKGGKIIWGEAKFFPRINSSGKLELLEGIIQDKTDEFHTKSELERITNIKDSIMANLDGFVYRGKFNGQLEIIYINDHVSEITGYTASELMGLGTQNIADLIIPDDITKVKEKINQAITNEKKWDIDYRVKRKDGEIIWVNESGKATVINNQEIILDALVRDVTSTKEKLDRLILGKQKYDLVIQNTHVGTWEWNVQTGETSFNERWAEMIGYQLKELEPTNIETWIHRVHPQDIKRSEKMLQRHFNGVDDYYEIELRMLHKQGHYIWIMDTGKLLSRTSDGLPLVISGIHQDITARKQIEQKMNFERVLANISREFVNYNDINEAINSSLKKLGLVTNASRIYLFLKQRNGQLMDNTHEWCAEGVEPQIDLLKDLPTNSFSWSLGKLERGEIIHIPDVSKMPDEARAEREILEMQDIKSLILVGLRIQENLEGFVGFDNVQDEMTVWSQEDLNLLLWLVQIFSNAFEAKRAKEKLRKSELKFRNIFELNPSPQLLIDPINGDILELNEAALNFYGYQADQIITKNFIELTGLNAQRNSPAFAKKLSLLTNNSYLETQQKVHNGAMKMVELFSGIITIDEFKILHVIMHDITDKIRIYDRNQLLRTAIDNSPISIVITDVNGKIEDANQNFMQVSGYNMPELKGQNTRIFNSGNHEPSFFKNLWTTILAGNPWTGEIENKKKDGTLYWEKMTIVPIFVNDSISKFVAIKMDITEHRLLLKQLTLAKETAEESDKLKSAFLSTINHELRTPLNHVIGMSDIIADLTTESSIKEFSLIVQRSGLHLLEIIEDILSLAMADPHMTKAKKENIRILDIYLMLKDVLIEIHNKSGKHENIEIKFNPDKNALNLVFESDRSMINMILTNFFKNALKFTDIGTIAFGYEVADNHVNFFVKDEGIGIPDEKQEIIFEFFRQADDTNTRKHDGLGVGLAIAKRAADSIGAKIILHSKYGLGSEFILSIPITPMIDSGFSQTESNSPQIELNLAGKNILIVDDDKDSLMLTRNILKSTNAQITEAINGQQAIDAFRSHSFDLILMDLKMPVLDGYTATRIIRTENTTLPIIGLTSYSFVQDQIKAKEAGCNDVITKPINKTILLSRLKQYFLTD